MPLNHFATKRTGQQLVFRRGLGSMEGARSTGVISEEIEPDQSRTVRAARCGKRSWKTRSSLSICFQLLRAQLLIPPVGEEPATGHAGEQRNECKRAVIERQGAEQRPDRRKIHWCEE